MDTTTHGHQKHLREMAKMRTLSLLGTEAAVFQVQLSRELSQGCVAAFPAIEEQTGLRTPHQHLVCRNALFVLEAQVSPQPEIAADPGLERDLGPQSETWALEFSNQV